MADVPLQRLITEITDLPTAEMDDSLVLAPDGAGGLEFRAEGGGGGGGGAGIYLIAPSSDTQIASTNTTTNYDTADEIFVTNAWGTASTTRFLLMTFNIAALAALDVVSAILHLSAKSGTGFPARLEARECIRAYVPNEVTWNVYSTGNNWGTAGAANTTSDVVTDRYGSAYVGYLDARMGIDITPLVKAYAAASTGTLRLVIGSAGTASSNAIGFHAIESATAAKRPVLHVLAG
jgi:hypothetical protein